MPNLGPKPTTGERIRTRRKLRGWSVRLLADRAGVAPSTVSRIERGERSADNRYLLADLAAALECSVSDLTGQPHVPADRASQSLIAGVHRIRAALVEVDLDEISDVTDPRPLAALAEEVELARSLRERCDYVGLGQTAPRLLRELHAHSAGPDRERALRMLLEATYHAGAVVRYVGNPAEMWLAAERCRDIARALNDPVSLAFAAYERAHAATACGLYPRSLAIAQRAVTELDRNTNQPGALELLGQLQLTCAFAAYGAKRPADGAEWLETAAQLAERVGDTQTHGLFFGPTNVKFWQVAIETDAGDPGRAAHIAAGTNPAKVTSASRQVAFYSDSGRALARIDRIPEAERMLLTAERLAPHRIRASAALRETARSMLVNSRRRETPLRGLCERMGVATA